MMETVNIPSFRCAEAVLREFVSCGVWCRGDGEEQKVGRGMGYIKAERSVLADKARARLRVEAQGL